MNKNKWLGLFALAVFAVFGCRTADLIGQDLGLVQPTAQAQATAVPRANGGQVTPMPVQPVAPTAPVVQGCRVIHDYALEPLPEVATSGSFIHVSFYKVDGDPVQETLLPGPARYKLTQHLKGKVFEYAPGCTEQEVRKQIADHIQRRIAQKEDNKGYVDWKSTGFFQQIAP